MSADLMTSPRTVAIDERKAPEDCVTMVDVRQGVDALDRALVTLLAERQRYGRRRAHRRTATPSSIRPASTT